MRLALFLLHLAAAEDEGESKEAEEEGVFLRFGDDGAVHSELEGVGWAGEKSAGLGRRRQAVEGSRIEVADGLGQQAGASPIHSFG